MNFTRTFDDLNRVMSTLLKASASSKKCILSSFFEGDYRVEARVIAGLIFFKIPFAVGLSMFRSNRFFLDSVQVKILPDLSRILEVLGYISSSVPDGSDVIDYIYGELNNVFLELEDLDSPEIFKNFNFPILNESHLKFLDENGYLIVQNAIPEDLCDELRARALSLARLEQEQEKSYVYGSGKMQRVYNLLGKDSLFRDVVLHPLAHQVMAHMFHRDTFHLKYYLCSFHANFIEPGGESQILHVDANVPDPLPKWIIRSNSNFIVEDYSWENGATQVVPGSHKYFAKPDPEKFDEHKLISIEAPKGSMVFWHGGTWHRSGENHSKKARVALLAGYVASFMREMCLEENPYFYMSPSIVSGLKDPLKRVIGWNHGDKNY